MVSLNDIYIFLKFSYHYGKSQTIFRAIEVSDQYTSFKLTREVFTQWLTGRINYKENKWLAMDKVIAVKNKTSSYF